MHIENATDLKTAIVQLEQKRIIQERLLIEHANMTFESLKPVNILKNTFSELSHSKGVKANLLDAGLGLGAGLITKKLMIGSSKSIFRRLIGAAFEMAIATLVAKNSGKIKDAGKGIMGFLGNHKPKTANNLHNDY